MWGIEDRKSYAHRGQASQSLVTSDITSPKYSRIFITDVAGVLVFGKF